MFGCSLKMPPVSVEAAAKTAVSMNAANTPAIGALPGGVTLQPQHIALMTTKYWGNEQKELPVSFLESTSNELADRIISHLNAWTCGITFRLTAGTGIIRISRGRHQGGGYWSYLGTDVLHIADSLPTMNLEGFTMATSEAEYRRVVRHEAGHTLGCPHEHMRKELIERIDREKAYAWFQEQYGWSQGMVNSQVLTPLSEKSLMRTPPDQTSIMCYQLPGEITKDGKPITGGNDINSTDDAFIDELYPLSLTNPDEGRDDETVYTLINKERQQQGLRKLQIGTNIQAAAQYWAKRMYDIGGWITVRSHSDLFTLLPKFKVNPPALYAGENIAQGQRTDQEVFDDWMASPGHRRNILGAWTRMGIGRAGDYWCLIFAYQNLPKRTPDVAAEVEARDLSIQAATLTPCLKMSPIC